MLVNKLQYIQTVDYYSEIKRNYWGTHRWISRTLCGKKPDSNGCVLCNSVYTTKLEKVKLWEARRDNGCQGLGVVGKGLTKKGNGNFGVLKYSIS